MPVLTRGAASLLLKAHQGPESAPNGANRTAGARRIEADVGPLDRRVSEGFLALREPVAKRSEVVWTHRGGVDVYTRQARDAVVRPQVDHVIEIQLVEHAMMYALAGVSSESVPVGGSIAQLHVAQRLRDEINSVGNLNVTSAKVNQAKRGPVTAAMNRLRASAERGAPLGEGLRLLTLEQLARQGRARWLVDEGVWGRIEREIVRSFDSVRERTESTAVATPGTESLTRAALDGLEEILGRLGVFDE